MTENVKSRDIDLDCDEVVDIRNVRIPLGPHISEPVAQSIRCRDYEADELDLLSQTLLDNDVVLEIGAGIGLISTFCSKRVGSDSVFAFEANPALEAPIRKMYRLNDVAPNLCMALLGHSIGVQDFFVQKDFCSSSTIRMRDDDQQIAVNRLLFSEQLRTINPTFLIIDIEGGEYDLLMDADVSSVKKILIELHTSFMGVQKAKALLNKLKSQGFEVNRKVTYSLPYRYSVKRRTYELLRHSIERLPQALSKPLEFLCQMAPQPPLIHGSLLLENTNHR
jgi:FkbM family methyltransferase